MSNPHVLGVIQARMGSTRLPGKVLAPILGEPMVWRIWERLRHSKCLDATVIATTTQPADEELAQFAAADGVGCYRGSVDDLVERLYGALMHFGGEILVRVWGDCPCMDPRVIDEAVIGLMTGGLDYISNVLPGERTFPEGLAVEVYRRSVLETIRRETSDAFYREFPFEYVACHPHRFRWESLRNHEDLSHIHLTVDYPADLEFIRAIYQALYTPREVFSFQQAVDWVRDHPDRSSQTRQLARNTEYLTRRAER